MQVVIVREDNTVVVNARGYKIDCSALPEEIHAISWDSDKQRGEVEYALMVCGHCGGRSKKHNDALFNFEQYQPYVDAWKTAWEAEQKAISAAAAEAQARAAENAPRSAD